MVLTTHLDKRSQTWTFQPAPVETSLRLESQTGRKERILEVYLIARGSQK